MRNTQLNEIFIHYEKIVYHFPKGKKCNRKNPKVSNKKSMKILQ